MIRRFALALALVPGALFAQSRQDYAARRLQIETKLPDGALIVLGAQEPAQDYLSFYQAPSFLWLTGFREPDAALLMVKRGGAIVSSTMFVRPRQPSREVWTGSRVGVQGVERLTGLRGRATNDLWPTLDSLGKSGTPIFVVGDIGAQESDEPEPPTRISRTNDELLYERLKRHWPTLKVTVANDQVEQLRGTKTPAELALIRQAVEITSRAHREAMTALKDGMNEFEIQALIEYTFRRNGADRPAFASIVGSGPNSTTLHYNTNDRFIEPNDVVVMDIGASYKGYAADITRTIPASGHFSLVQRDIYQLVRDAQAAAERQLKIGAPIRLMNDSADDVLARGLAKLKLIDSPNATFDCSAGPTPRQCPQLRMYYMHSLGHGIGLEVHDPDQYSWSSKLEPGSVFTIEPGIYVREHLLEEIPDTPRNRELASRLRPAVTLYRNIGVRIEDNYAVTDKGVEWLSKGAPREIAEIEALMKQGSTGPAKRDGEMVGNYRKN